MNKKVNLGLKILALSAVLGLLGGCAATQVALGKKDLVVETTQISYPYLDDLGVPQSTESRMIERFSLDGEAGVLNWVAEITDPVNLTEALIRDIHDGTLSEHVVVPGEVRDGLAGRIGKKQPRRARELEQMINGLSTRDYAGRVRRQWSAQAHRYGRGSGVPVRRRPDGDRPRQRLPLDRARYRP